MKKIYLAGKLNDMACDYIKNCSKMIRAAIKLQKEGNAVFVPCIDFLTGLVAGDFEYNNYADQGLVWLEVCDEIDVLPGWEQSKGTIAEIARAIELNIPVVYL